ncbi:long-chain fatty acid--CoA ligase [Aeromicrobium ginsengisoli]|uniref:Long-chain fatty acid--CoA ligase n=1 Tax=Aeromicrobium ginsengisoli TaxID=363867 RepID=A0A5M4FG90_9ACTN|nr:long-chain fatty acid--CoA ligase [Aeromicrobium ginsengisoli]
MPFSSLLDHRAALDPQGRAVSDSARTFSNAELLDRVHAAAFHLRELGIGPGDVVALKLTNRVEFIVLLFAAWRIGATITPVNPSLTAGEVARQLDDSRTKLMVVEPASETLDTAAGVPVLDVGELRKVVEPGSSTEPFVDPSALALLIYTSGTTGVPKGVMLDHANLEAMAQMGLDAFRLDATDTCLLILPLFHVNGIAVSVLMPLLAGANVVVASRFHPDTFFDLVEAERPTFFSGVPTIFSMLATMPAHIRPDTSSVRFAICGAAPAPAELLERFESRFAVPIIEAYGLSEATCGSTTNPIDGPRMPGTVGLPFPGQELRILGHDGTEVPVGVDGEVVVAGPNVMRGYLGRPEETDKVLVDGWLRTGDVGHLDDDGYLTLVGRSKEMIIRGGENIYPKEIEDVLTGDPAVLDAAVIGIPDDMWGEIVVAYVEPEPSEVVDIDALHARCATSLSGYKRPLAIHVVDALPRNAVGKIAKLALRDHHSASHENEKVS